MAQPEYSPLEGDQKKRIFIVCAIETGDQFHEALNKFLATRFKKDSEPILFVYNIGSPEEVQAEVDKATALIQAPNRLIVFHNDEDLMSLKPYKQDYLMATADATVIGTQLAGISCEDFRFYNYFNAPKIGNKQFDFSGN